MGEGDGWSDMLQCVSAEQLLMRGSKLRLGLDALISMVVTLISGSCLEGVDQALRDV